MNLSEAIAQHAGPPPVRTPVPSGFRSAVSVTGEFRRIAALPRRQWESWELSDIIEDGTRTLRQPDALMRLWPVQALALLEIAQCRGGFLPIGVGLGKALISLLAAVVLKAERPVLFVPAQLRTQTLVHVIPALRSCWKLPEDLRVLGYSELSLAKNARMLEEINPDLIILDECHRVKNPKAGRTRRLIRWFRAHPETMCVAMSGTVSNRSICDFAHIIRWCLRGRTPLPERWPELCEWAAAIDEKVLDEQRVAPGALEQFCFTGENVRQGFRRRLTETPGVVATQESLLGTSLVIALNRQLTVPERCQSLMRLVEDHWKTPGGDDIAEPVEMWRTMRQLALGFYYEWDPPAPLPWLRARSAWKKYVRETLQHNRRGLDTELQVWNACARLKEEGKLPANSPWFDWDYIRGSFKPNTVAHWVDAFTLKHCGKWLDSCSESAPGICWVEHVEFGRRLAEVSGHPYFGAGDDSILDCEAPAIIASWQAHGEGKNLQRCCRNLVSCPPASGKACEQLIARTHRAGQQADEVTVEVLLHTEGLEKSWEQARNDARYLEDTFGNRQKLNYAAYVEEK